MPHAQQPVPCGAWNSPVASALVAADSVRIGDIALDRGDIYWSEMRPADNARNVIVRRAPNGTIADITPPGCNVRTRVHEYGGGAFTASNAAIYFSNYDDQRLYRQDLRPGSDPTPQPITPPVDMRYADAAVCERRRLLICVREDHTSAWREPVNSIAAIDLRRGGAARVLASGRDFYSNPRLSPNGEWLVWLSWNHPNMPWDGCELWAAQLAPDGTPQNPRRVAGGPSESIFQPEWSPEGALHFASDRSGWWNIYRCENLTPDAPAAAALCPMNAEFAMPAWALGMSTYGFASDRRIICAYAQSGIWRIGEIDPDARALREIPTPFNDIGAMRVSPDHAVFTAGSPAQPLTIMRHDFATGATQPLRSAPEPRLDSRYISQAQPIEFPTDGTKTAHAFYYPPTNPDCAPPDGEAPPTIVISHGGPTSAAAASFDMRKQFWTTRGFAIVDVNYGGSSGYGREYRQRLNGNWGVVDVADCVHAARHLAAQGLADPQRLIIRGSSAGGFTTLLALATRSDFRAGASYYGISELEALTRDTHKFESRYLDTLVGPFPQCADIYADRSAINHIDSLSAPMIIMQGLDDPVVPPSQAELMVNALRQKGLPVAYLTFAGEQHGFRKAESITRALDAELYFYARVFGIDAPGFDPSDPPVRIENLPDDNPNSAPNSGQSDAPNSQSKGGPAR